jgi:glycosyltransferase involved in cell wall biosynthesis
MPIFSIIIPVYNVRDYLEHALTSIAQQSFKDFEVVVVDDGSTDGSSQIAKAFCANDSRFLYIHQPNAGASAARNTGTALASGTFVYYMDADDELVFNALEVCHRELTGKNVDAVLFGAEVFPDDVPSYPKYCDYYQRPHMLSPTSSDVFVMESLRQNRYFVSPCCYVAKRSTIGNRRFIEGIMYEDNHFFAMLFTDRKIAVSVINDKLFRRRLRANSVTSSKRSLSNYNSIDQLIRELSFLSFSALSAKERGVARSRLIGEALGDLQRTSAMVGAGMRVRIRNIAAAWHVARYVNFRLLFGRRGLLAVAPELYRFLGRR